LPVLRQLLQQAVHREDQALSRPSALSQ
jgi:hypothetical protein